MGIAEIFSIFFERLIKNMQYLSSLGIQDERTLAKFWERNNFMELFFVTFYTANSLMKAEFWHKDLSIESATDLCAKLIMEYTDFEIPCEYWMLHRILPEAVIYVPSYLLAAVRSAELDLHLRCESGSKWWTDASVGKYIREIIGPWTKIDLAMFSKLDSNLFLKEITEEAG